MLVRVPTPIDLGCQPLGRHTTLLKENVFARLIVRGGFQPGTQGRIRLGRATTPGAPPLVFVFVIVRRAQRVRHVGHDQSSCQENCLLDRLEKRQAFRLGASQPKQEILL